MFRTVRGARTGHRLLDAEPGTWPWLYGDSFDASPKNADPNQFLPLGGERLRMMEAWVRGDFLADVAVPAPSSIGEYPLALQPAALDRASLDFCVADAFHPGIELTWPMRHLSIYSERFRIRRRQDPEPDYGPMLDTRIALGAGGPLHGQSPGSLSRWMLVPWQIDTGGCLSGYLTNLLEDGPSFWPARVPNTVLSHANYLKAIEPGSSAADRSEAFAERRSWFYRLGTSNWGEQLIDAFGSMGVIEAYEGLAGDRDIPPTIYAETLPPAPPGGLKAETPAAEAADPRGIPDPAERDAMRRMRFGH
nr:LodA/GoxA family CTQ-dependent oxidase [Amaricoccus macauensis]